MKTNLITDEESVTIDKPLLDELRYLRYFFQTADFGPAHEDVVSIINDGFVHDTEEPVPEGYGEADEEAF